MELKKLSDSFFISSQVLPADLAFLKAEGFGYIICNRPDGEEDAQPTFEEVAEAVSKHGLTAFYLPIYSVESISDEMVEEFARLLMAATKPVVAYCRSGARSRFLYLRAEPLLP